MKNILVAAALLSLFSCRHTDESSSANAAKTNDVRLELIESEYRYPRTAESGSSVTISILKGGKVTKKVCLSPANCKTTTVKSLSASEMSLIESKITSARHGTTESVTEFCEAIPSQSLQITADNGKLRLYAGASPCGGHSSNNAPEAKELVKLIENLK